MVEGFALRVVQGDVPPPLKNVQVRTLDLALLQAGAGVKGEFENRLKGLIEEVKSSTTPIILFIDEAHTMIGAGGQEGKGEMPPTCSSRHWAQPESCYARLRRRHGRSTRSISRRMLRWRGASRWSK